MTLKNIAIIGANGKLGPSILKALLSAEQFNVSVLSRASSTSVYSPNIRVIRIPDALDHDRLTEALRGQDALIIAMAGNKVAEQLALSHACSVAGVRRVIPADFGSCDSADPYTQSLLPLFAGKAKVRAYLEQLAAQPDSVLSWTGIVTGHFFDYGLKTGLLKFDLVKRRAWILDSGDVRWSATTLDMIGSATAKVLQMESETKNKLLYIQSFCISQMDLLGVLEQVTNVQWAREYLSSQELIEARKEAAYGGDAEATEEIVSVHGLVASNWEEQARIANDMLGLPKEDLETIVRSAISA